MKVIDLVEKQRNNEMLPKHIRYENEDLYFDGLAYFDKEKNNDLLDILAIHGSTLTHLYDEIEIIEEDKDIEKINWKEKESLAGTPTQKEQLEILARRSEKTKKVLNELIDEVNRLKNKG